MTDTRLQERQQALEDAFYRDDAETYRHRLELRKAEDDAFEDLAAASGSGLGPRACRLGYRVLRACAEPPRR